MIEIRENFFVGRSKKEKKNVEWVLKVENCIKKIKIKLAFNN